MKKHLTILTVIFTFTLIFSPCSAKQKKGNPDYLVRISQKKSTTPKTGFIVNYSGKTAVICDSKAFGQETVIKDSKGEEIEYSEVWVPAKEEKRKILIIILSEEYSGLSKLKIAAKFANGDSVSTQGYSASTGKIYKGSGKITEVGKRKITLTGKVRKDISGAPVLLKSKQVIGVGKCMKTKKMEMPYAERIDNLADFAKIVAEDIKKEEKTLTNLQTSVREYGKTYLKLKKIIEDSGYNEKSSFKHLEDKELKELKEEIKELSEKLEEIKKELSDSYKSGKSSDDLVIPTFNNSFRSSLARAEEIIERKCKPMEEKLEKITDALDKAF